MQDKLKSVLTRAEELYRDLTFASVKEWKQKTGGLAVGYMPIYVPCELFHSQQVLPVGIMGGGDGMEIIRGDAYYQSYICHIPRSTIEMGLNGSLDCLEGMIFPAICDVIRNLSGMWKLQFPDKLSKYLDVPQNFEREIGGRFYKRELLELSEELTARGARAYDPEALRASIVLYNENRKLIREVYELRVTSPWKVPTAELYLMLRAGCVLPVEEFSPLLAEYIAAVKADDSRRPMDQARVLLAGSFCEQPPLGLIKTLERSGCYIVEDDLVRSVEPNPDCKNISPAEGKICVKAYGLVQKLYNPDRIKTPLIRTNPKKGKNEDPRWREATWDEALGMLAAACGSDPGSDATPRGGDDIVVDIGGNDVVLTSSLSGFDSCDALLDHLRTRRSVGIGDL